MTQPVAAHVQPRTLRESLFYPEHQSRKASAEYREIHNELVVVRDEPCWRCGVRRSTLADPAANRFAAKDMETHHAEVEWALANAMDVTRLLADFPQIGVADEAHVRAWLDSEGNMLVLCDVCHRHPNYGIHMITYPAWKPQKWSNYDLARGPLATQPHVDGDAH